MSGIRAQVFDLEPVILCVMIYSSPQQSRKNLKSATMHSQQLIPPTILPYHSCVVAIRSLRSLLMSKVQYSWPTVTHDFPGKSNPDLILTRLIY